MIDIFVKGDVVTHLLSLHKTGAVRDCKHLVAELDYLDAYYPKCEKGFAKRVPADNVLLDDGAYCAPSSYYWPECPKDCPHFARSDHFAMTLSGEEIKKTIDKDDLLPISPRRTFDKSFEEMLTRAREKSEPASLIMIDIDHFKKVNDKHGHQVGDEVLVAVANFLNATIRRKGNAFRYGGEELAVLAANFSGAEALSLAERFRRDLEVRKVSSREIMVTVSCGVASFPEHADNPADLVKLADTALYKAKELGRNCVLMTGESIDARPPLRQVIKREPTFGSYTEEQIEKIRVAYFTQGSAWCPTDNAVLVVELIDELGSRTPSLYVRCHLCGVSVDVPGIRE